MVSAAVGTSAAAVNIATATATTITAAHSLTLPYPLTLWAQYICRLVKLADEKMAENQRRTDALLAALRDEFCTDE